MNLCHKTIITCLLSMLTLMVRGEPPAEHQAEVNDLRWKTMTEAEREVVRNTVRNIAPDRFGTLKEKMERFRALPMEEQLRIRENFKVFNQLARDEKQEIKKKYAHFQSLPEHRQSAIRNRVRRNTAQPDSDLVETNKTTGRPSLEELLRRYDKNGDGILTGPERRAVGSGKHSAKESRQENPK